MWCCKVLYDTENYSLFHFFKFLESQKRKPQFGAGLSSMTLKYFLIFSSR